MWRPHRSTGSRYEPAHPATMLPGGQQTVPTQSDYALPLNAIRARARMRLASNGNEATNLYIHDAVYRCRSEIPSAQTRRYRRSHATAIIDIFADDEPLRNWEVTPAAIYCTTLPPAS